MYVVFDLDGTLVKLNVDWNKAAAKLREMGWKGNSLWTIPLYNKDFFVKNKEKISSIYRECEMEAIQQGKDEPLEFLNVLDKINNYSIVTNNSVEVALAIVKKYDLKPDLIIGRESVKFPKPYPDPLDKVIDQLNLKREDVLFVGDTVWDAMTARNAGVLFLSVNVSPIRFLKFLELTK